MNITCSFSSFLHLTCMWHLICHSYELMLYDANFIFHSSNCMRHYWKCLLYTCYLLVCLCWLLNYDAFLLLITPLGFIACVVLPSACCMLLKTCYFLPNKSFICITDNCIIESLRHEIVADIYVVQSNKLVILVINFLFQGDNHVWTKIIPHLIMDP